jgi:hypothetical protein
MALRTALSAAGRSQRGKPDMWERLARPDEPLQREIAALAADPNALRGEFLIANAGLEFRLTHSKVSPLTFSNREYIAVFHSISRLGPGRVHRATSCAASHAQASGVPLSISIPDVAPRVCSRNETTLPLVTYLSAVAGHSPLTCLPGLACRGRRVTDFLIGTPRLEFRATHRKQRAASISNRDTIALFYWVDPPWWTRCLCPPWRTAFRERHAGVSSTWLTSRRTKFHGPGKLRVARTSIAAARWSTGGGERACEALYDVEGARGVEEADDVTGAVVIIQHRAGAGGEDFGDRGGIDAGEFSIVRIAETYRVPFLNGVGHDAASRKDREAHGA